MRHIARWDLDKTYLRTEFDTLRDIVRTAFERADEKRTNPGAGTLMREMVKAGNEVHVLSGSPEQMRKRIEEKLRLDGVTWHSLTLKPNLKNILRLRLRAVKDQLGYKLPMLLAARASIEVPDGDALPRETLFGDDSEADVFVYALFADFLSGKLEQELLVEVMERGLVYEDVLEQSVRSMNSIVRGDVVERIFIHLEGQSPPSDFHIYGPRVVPFYNYFQAALVLHEDDRISSEGVLRVATELLREHRFNGERLARSHQELARRGHLRGTRVAQLEASLAREPRGPFRTDLEMFVEQLPKLSKEAESRFDPKPDLSIPDYVALVEHHNNRRRKHR
ncbi:MAG: hypothetical protein U0174_13145 [Polyangiaceae bacterium]